MTPSGSNWGRAITYGRDTCETGTHRSGFESSTEKRHGDPVDLNGDAEQVDHFLAEPSGEPDGNDDFGAHRSGSGETQQQQYPPKPPCLPADFGPHENPTS